MTRHDPSPDGLRSRDERFAVKIIKRGESYIDLEVTSGPLTGRRARVIPTDPAAAYFNRIGESHDAG